MNDTVYGKTMGNLRHSIDVKLVSNKKRLFKLDIQTRLHVKIFGNYLVMIRKNKVTLTINKRAYIGKCILELSKVLMYKFHYDYIKNKCGNNSSLLFKDNDSLMCKIKTGDIYKNFSNKKEMFNFSNYSTKSKYCDNSNKLVVDEVKDETADVAIEEFVGLKPKMYSYLVDDNSQHEKKKGANKNVVATISHNDIKMFC